MRCKRHPSDHSSTVGVCASCLRERLFSLIAAQAQVQQAQQQHQHQHQQHQFARSHPEVSRKSDSHTRPPPLIFPRSVSPYVSRRKSDDDTSSWSQNLRFYSTPQVGPTSYKHPASAASAATTSFPAASSSSSKKKHPGRFSLLSNLFRSRSDKFNPDPGDFNPESIGASPSSSSSSTSSWFSSVFLGHRQRQPKPFSSMECSAAMSRRPRRRSDRGMSPVERPESDEDCDRSPSGSGYSSESSSQGWKRTPAGGMRREKAAGHTRNVSGLAFCLSPLVRASPNRHWNHKGEMGFSGEVRIPVKPHLSAAASFCANRSRKLADFGRVNHNR